MVAGLTLLAALLSVPSLNSGLWTDEVLTLVHYARLPVAQILTSFPDQNQHMLYSLLAHGSMRIFGEQPWALRLPAVIFGAGSIWALFLLGRRLFGETEALLACALMTVSYHRIWFSQDARGYTGMLFFSLLATWLWLEAMERDKWRHLARLLRLRRARSVDTHDDALCRRRARTHFPDRVAAVGQAPRAAWPGRRGIRAMRHTVAADLCASASAILPGHSAAPPPPNYRVAGRAGRGSTIPYGSCFRVCEACTPVSPSLPRRS